MRVIEIETYKEIRDYRAQYKKFYLYGAGKRGTAILKEFMENDINVDAVVVSSKENNPDNIWNIPVIALDEIETDNARNVFFIGVAIRAASEVVEYLKQNGHENILQIGEDGLEGKWLSPQKEREVFARAVPDYAYGRPGYTKELHDKIQEYAALGRGSLLLEVGAGTGQATDLFLPNEYEMDLIEISDEHVNYLKEKYAQSNITVHKSYFEEYQTDKKYDLIYSASAFHWVEPEIGYQKTWDMLKDGGTLALFWNYSSLIRHEEGIHPGINAIRERYMYENGTGWDEKKLLDKDKTFYTKWIREAGYDEPECFVYKWAETYDTERFISFHSSLAETIELPENKSREMLDEIRDYVQKHGGMIEVPQTTMLIIVKK